MTSTAPFLLSKMANNLINFFWMFFTWNHQTLVRTSSDNWTKAHGLCWNYFWRKNLTVSQNEITSVCVLFTKFLHSFFVFIIFLDDESRQGKNGTTTSFWRVGSPHHWDLAGSLAWRTRRVWKILLLRSSALSTCVIHV